MKRKRLKEMKPGQSPPGQALVEFVMVLPVLILILFAVYYVGTAMYAGATASSAMKEPVMNKLALANIPGNATGQALSLAQAYKDGSFAMTGSTLDAVQITFPTNVTAVMVGKKNYTPSFAGLPAFPFTVTQGINGNLLQANTGTANANNWQPPLSQRVVASEYGIQPTTGMMIPMASPTCGASGTLDIAKVNLLIDGTVAPATPVIPATPAPPPVGGAPAVPVGPYVLLDFSPPDPGTVPAADAKEAFNATYSAPAYIDDNSLKSLMNMPNAACDAPATQLKYTTECAAEGADPATCPAKKTSACRLQYANRFTADTIQLMQATGSCNGAIGNTSGATFPGTAGYQY